jgi:hypothetical protein
MRFLESYTQFNLISENLKYHLENKVPIFENVFRPGSESFYKLLEEVRTHFDKGNIVLEGIDKELFGETELGKFDLYEGRIVPLDLPMENDDIINEAEYKGKKVKLNKPMRSSGPKKYKVYVKNPKTGKVNLVHFGDAKGGLTSKISDPAARKSFAARHRCKEKTNKMSPGFWSCNLPRYGKLLGLSTSGNFYW